MPACRSPGAAPSGAQLSGKAGREGFARAFKEKRQFRQLKAFGKGWLLETNVLFSDFFWLEVNKKLHLDTFKAENTFCIVSIENGADFQS